MDVRLVMDEAVGTADLPLGLDRLGALAAELGELRTLIGRLAALGDTAAAKSLGRLDRQLARLEPSVTMIGQVKAGKTALVNAMVGQPGLLPSDVNPWTSVVTSLHLNAPDARAEARARFRFFDRDEWDRLMTQAGRIGELAQRAGAETELEALKAQVEAMREKTKARLGRRFEMLLGQEQAYAEFDRALIERYVCLGDDILGQDEKRRGFFADITKSADLYFDRPDCPMALCIRDTPGVNDTFMMREQITINAIRQSRLCVVVLSAHQALSSVDLALIRLISNVKSREVVIFVNRIDELADPVRQIDEIRASITETLQTHRGPEEAEILFGSAHWANLALSDRLDEMSPESRAALEAWAVGDLHPSELRRRAWQLSGLPALFTALSERIAEGDVTEAMARAAREAGNVANGMRGAHKVVALRLAGEAKPPNPQRVEAAWRQIRQSCLTRFDTEYGAISAEFDNRLERARRSFLSRATGVLLRHLEKLGPEELWQYDPTGLRVLLRGAYQALAGRSSRVFRELLGQTAGEIGQLQSQAFGLAEGSVHIAFPAAPRLTPPVEIGQTIALDLKTTWWRRWWQRQRGYDAFAMEFAAMIAAETDPILAELKSAQMRWIETEARAALTQFLDDQESLLRRLASKTRLDRRDLQHLGGSPEELDALIEGLAPFASMGKGGGS